MSVDQRISSPRRLLPRVIGGREPLPCAVINAFLAKDRVTQLPLYKMLTIALVRDGFLSSGTDVEKTHFVRLVELLGECDINLHQVSHVLARYSWGRALAAELSKGL